MLDQREIEQLLTLQSRAYHLLLWLADEATRNPSVLGPAAVAALAEPETAAGWLRLHRERFPVGLSPDDPAGPFANLFCSFFATSFHVKHLEFAGRLLESRVTVGVKREYAGGAGLEQCQALALRHLAAAERSPITEKEARSLVRRKSLQEAALLWSYVWELDRRAKNKGKGTVVHRIWRSLPRGARRSLSVEQVWQARQQLLKAVLEATPSLAPQEAVGRSCSIPR